ncbi:MAG: NAD+ synthase [Desulfurococcales archaeon]|nr:NAD+ synthase [Desulfurococcales archaeon]
MARITLDHVVNLDYDRVTGMLESFIREKVEEAGVKGVVVGVSGGVDSATTLYLSARALGARRVMGLVMPDSTVTPKEDIDDAIELLRGLGVEFHVVDIAPIVDVYKSSLPIYEAEEGPDRVPVGNLRARIRMSILYYYANKLGYMVAGTGDRSEILIGYFTKYGDGAVDILPIGVLYKSQVRRLAATLGVPERVAYKPSSPRLWRGQTAEGELGVSYDQVDLVLFSIFDLGLSPEETVEATGVPKEVVDKVLERYRASEHKRNPPPAPSLEPIKEMMLANTREG